MSVLAGLKPERVFYYFEELCKIPHGSGNIEAISNYLVDFAKEHEIKYVQDEMKNVILFKDATEGYENSGTVMLQGHMDMVCAKRPDVSFDFLSEGLKLGIDGDYIHANGTTLGGDNGIAVAYILALMEAKDLKHPALEGVITVDEEIGLLGAKGLDCSELKSKCLINMDSEEEGVLTVGCAGGLRTRTRLPIGYMEAEGISCKLRLEGLKGGHSGVDIPLGRANANVLMGRVLFRLTQCADFTIVKIEGGEADNAIPRFCEAEVLFLGDEEQMKAAQECLDTLRQEIAVEYRTNDPDIQLIFEPDEKKNTQAFSYVTTEKLIFLLYNLPNGVMRMSPDIEGLVQTSLNLGVLKTEEDVIAMEHAVRSSLESEKHMTADRVVYMVQFLGGECICGEEYPGWAYDPDSRIRELMIRVYEEMNGKKPVVEAIHAGLECGLISAKIEGLDCVSVGPDMSDVHTPEERLKISSVERVWDYMIKVLEACK